MAVLNHVFSAPVNEVASTCPVEVHESEKLKAILDAISIENPSEFNLFEIAPKPANSALSTPRSSWLVIHPFAADKARWLPGPLIKELLDFASEKRLSAVLVGSQAELSTLLALAPELQGFFSTRTFDSGFLADLQSEIDIFAGSDSGPGHLLAALGLPTLTFGLLDVGENPRSPHSPERFRPIGSRSSWLSVQKALSLSHNGQLGTHLAVMLEPPDKP